MPHVFDRYARWACALATAMLLPAIAPARPITDAIPAKSHLAFWIDDIEATKNDLAENGFYQLVADEETGVGAGSQAVRKTVGRLPISPADPLYTFWGTVLPIVDSTLQGSIASATSVFQFKAQDMAETFTGSLALYSTLYDLYEDNEVEIVEWDVILAADYKPEEREKVERFLETALARVPKDARKSKVDYFGQDVYHLTYYIDEQAALPGSKKDDLDLGLVQEIPVIVEYTFLDDMFLMAEGRGDPLKRVVRALSEEGQSLRLDNDPGYRRANELLADEPGRFHFYANIDHYVREMGDLPSNHSTKRLLEAIGLGESGPFLARIAVDGDGTRLAASILSQESPKGMFKVLANSPENNLERLKMVPPDAQMAGSLSLDFAILYDQYRQAMAIIDARSKGFFDTAINAVQNLAGVDFRNDIMSAASGELLTYTRVAPSTQDGQRKRYDAAFVVPLNGGKEPVDAINAVLKHLTGEQTRLLDLDPTDYQGHLLWETPDTVTGNPIGTYLAATPTGFATASSGSALREIIRNLSSPPDENVLRDEDLASILSRIDKNNLRGLVYIPDEAVAKDYQIYVRLQGNDENSVDSLDVDAKTGPAWWTLHSIEGDLVFHYAIEPPMAGGR